MKNIESQNENQYGDHLDPRHFRAQGTTVAQLGRAQLWWRRWNSSAFSSATNSIPLLAIAVFFCEAVLSMNGTAIAQTQEKSGTSPVSPPLVAEHFSRGRLESSQANSEAIAVETADALAGKIVEPVMRPTRSSFLAKWQAVSGATGYRLDVSTTPSFDSCLAKYLDVDVGNVTNHIVSGLRRGTEYYYRVRAYNSSGVGNAYEVKHETTKDTASGLVVIPTFDSTIISDPRSSAIQAMIISSIEKYQTLFSDPITVSIRFRYSGFNLDGTPMGNQIGHSDSTCWIRDWNTYMTALRADGKTANDATATEGLPTTALSSSVVIRSAVGRAVGLDTPPMMFEDGTLGPGGPYDGIVTINSLTPVQFTRPVSPDNFDGQMFTEHEIDEVLGMGSHLNSPRPEFLEPTDLFSWASLNARNTSASGQRFFSIDRGFHFIAQFNQNPEGDFGDFDADDFCPANRLYVQNAFNCPGQSTDISATSPEGIGLDVIGYDLLPAIPASGVLGNISTRLAVGTGDNVLIAGFIITGSDPKQLVLRGIGPTLAQFGVTNAMEDTTLELHDSGGAVLATNDDWQDASNAQFIPPTLQPRHNLESALLVTLDPGAYSVVLRGYRDGTGTALVEVYDIGEGNAELSNISSRGFVQTGNNVMIAGVVVQYHNKRMIVRALGPSLGQPPFNLPGSLPDPILEIHDANGGLLVSNDDWRDTQDLAIIATGLAPTNDLESAIVATCTPGNYTAIVRGFNNATGNAVVEVYGLD